MTSELHLANLAAERLAAMFPDGRVPDSPDPWGGPPGWIDPGGPDIPGPYDAPGPRVDALEE